jgi:hypothetical protein
MSDEIRSYKDMPQDRITMACFTYMVRVTELGDFNSFFFGIINGSNELSLRMTEESKKTFRNAVRDNNAACADRARKAGS